MRPLSRAMRSRVPLRKARQLNNSRETRSPIPVTTKKRSMMTRRRMMRMMRELLSSLSRGRDSEALF